ncbi:phosphate propanoyltransferase [Tissierella sp. MSJ-40]|uniref:Phosphate propanoyltransferase n=1 Tax=Tissierella simiarum TaxID=2841534 RepID=A0ABS6E7I9_9FIRM|nr:phosphate propanoyltransferase [Tissierella simiarum]MBU5438887.1 phosphate propanoyltransferase [Tissierella simiarum]
MEINNQELAIKIANLIREHLEVNPEKKEIPVGVSNRHIHLSKKDLEILFGENYQLNELKELKQPGQFAAKEVVCIAGPKGSLSNVRVLGPVREESQLEISKTDSFTLGVKSPVRESGDLKGSGDICVIGPKGSVFLKEKVIVAKRHIHMTPEDAKAFNVINGQNVNVITSGERKTIFGDVIVRVSPKYSLEFHVDTDEANAADLSSKDTVMISTLNL